MRHTIADIAEALHIEKEIARGLVRFLVGVKEAEEMGVRPSATGRGRAEAVFEFKERFEVRIAERLVRAKLTD